MSVRGRKYLKLFDTHTEYQTYISGQDAILPNVSYCEDNNDVHYNQWIDPERIVAKFNVTNTTSPIYLFNNPNLLEEIEIDGVVQPSINTSYTFPTTGIHTVKYTLVDGTTNIDNATFAGREQMISITIPNTVTTIGSNAFGGCYNLKKITIPNTVTTIGTSAFAACYNLESIYIPSSVTSIASNAFQSCIGLTSIVVNSNNSTFDSRNNCNAIIDTLYNNLIVGCKNTIIPDSVTDIGDSAFYGCIGLESITIPSSVTYINGNAFSQCYITSDKFINNSNLNEVSNAYWSATIIDSDTNGFCIKNNTLYGYRGTSRNIIIPNTVTSINNYAFSNYQNITSITIPNSVTNIGEGAFYGCSGLTNVTIGNGVTTISKSTFYSCTSLTNITIPNSVTTIGQQAFQSCTGLTSITIPSSVTSIGQQAFDYCISLTSIVIPNGVTTIGNNTFSSCSSLTSITIPNNITSIGNLAFSSCSSLTSITSLATTAPTIQSTTFRNVKTGGTLTVPTGSTGYNTWMGTGNYYLGKYNWTKVEQ